LPVSIRHLHFRHYVAQLAGIDGEVREEVSLVFVDAAEPTERHRVFYARYSPDLLEMGHRNNEAQRDRMTRHESQRARFIGASIKLRQDRSQADDQEERDHQT